jgi:hypothetical protein
LGRAEGAGEGLNFGEFTSFEDPILELLGGWNPPEFMIKALISSYVSSFVAVVILGPKPFKKAVFPEVDEMYVHASEISCCLESFP